jgi:hypothetical protein
MNEEQWLTALAPGPMLDYLDGKASERKLRLIACGCARRSWGLFRYRTPREAVELAERLVDGKATAEEAAEMMERANASAGAAPMFEQPAYMAAAATLDESPLAASRNVCELARQQAAREAAYEVPPGHDEARATELASDAEAHALARLVREVIGNPFRLVVINPFWLHASNGIVGSLARLFDEEGRFGELPFLADALQDVGCSDEALLGHLREPLGHVRGCWALDLLLGRS